MPFFTSEQILNQAFDPIGQKLKTGSTGTAAAPSTDVISVQYPTSYVSKATLGALNAALTVDTLGSSQIVFNFPQATPAGMSVIFEGTNSNATTPTWVTLRWLNHGGPTVNNSSATQSAGAVAQVDTYGFTQIRCRVSAYTSGSCEVIASRKAVANLGPVATEIAGGTLATVTMVSAVSQINGYATTAYGSQFADTSTPLASGATFTSSARNSLAGSIGSYTITANSDQASAASGVKIQRSTNSTTWFEAWVGSLTANTPLQQKVWVTDPFMRVSYTNGATIQTSFLLSSATRIN